MRLSTTAAAAVLLAAAASANDGYAGLGAGGLEFGKSDAIAMADEALFLSRAEVRVDYTFVNTSPEDVQTIVAFQLPPLAPSYAEQDISMPDEVRSAGDLNYMDFRAGVNGRPVELETEVRFFKMCSDCEESGWGLSFLGSDDPELTDWLGSLNIPQSYDLATIRAWFAALPKADRSRLLQRGVFVQGEPDVIPNYWMSVRYYWVQAFPAGRPVTVSHAYRPVLGATVPMLDPEIEALHCVDADTRRAIEHAEGRIENQQYLEYVLTTANTWKGPIGHFTMTIDKGEPQDIVSLCAEGVRKTGPTTFVVEKRNYSPTSDIRIMFVDVAH